MASRASASGPASGGSVELGQVGEVGVDDVVDRLPDDGVVPSEREDSEAGQHVEVLDAVRVVEVGTLRPGVDLVEADGVQHPRQLRVQILAVQLVTLVSAPREHVPEVEWLVGRVTRSHR